MSGMLAGLRQGVAVHRRLVTATTLARAADCLSVRKLDCSPVDTSLRNATDALLAQQASRPVDLRGVGDDLLDDGGRVPGIRQLDGEGGLCVAKQLSSGGAGGVHSSVADVGDRRVFFESDSVLYGPSGVPTWLKA